MSEHTLLIARTTVRMYLPDNGQHLPLFISFLSPEEGAQLAALLADRAVLAVIDEADWEGCFSPWPAPKVFKQGADFAGGADVYIQRLHATLLPEIENRCGLNPCWRGVLGYSMAGLLAAYAAYRAPLFARVAAVSASLWFDGWTDFAAAERLVHAPQYAYFSVGEQEHKAKNPRLAQIETALLATGKQWQAQGVATHFERNPGGHFDDAPARLAKAAAWLLAQP
ncbi:putative alpha/beta superfamily hydrolase [Neisseria sp. HSC-16F19]|nr:alpha/beta hydrolase-fold protein [Neisseria sp. HSC-16F19]MCP2040087.1 putative alpha/beta superfamily hydrolase [Neisseria sp. HSC-16F19]